MGTFIKTKVKRNGIFAKNVEKAYVERNLTYYINKNKKTSRTSSSGHWLIQEDRETIFRQQLFEYTQEHFNLYELYVVFFNPSGFSYVTSDLPNERHKAIRRITIDGSFSLEEERQLKRKVWDMNPIFFGLMLEFINNSDLFWDREKETTVYPHWIVKS